MDISSFISSILVLIIIDCGTRSQSEDYVRSDVVIRLALSKQFAGITWRTNYCTGTCLSPTKVVTSQECVEDLASSNLMYWATLYSQPINSKEIGATWYVQTSISSLKDNRKIALIDMDSGDGPKMRCRDWMAMPTLQDIQAVVSNGYKVQMIGTAASHYLMIYDYVHIKTTTVKIWGLGDKTDPGLEAASRLTDYIVDGVIKDGE